MDERSAELEPTLTAYLITTQALEVPIVQASARREWMQYNNGNAYRCLPMTVANLNGWFLLNPAAFVAEWDGSIEGAQVKIEFLEPVAEAQQAFMKPVFDYGILTWKIPYLFRTSPGYNLMVRGPANLPKDGIQALEGLVETDWSESAFTMNWKFTRANHPVRFEKGEPFCMITPVRRGEIEQFKPGVRRLKDNERLHTSYRYWTEQRNKTVLKNQFIRHFKKSGPAYYELDYMQGRTAEGKERFAEHQTRLNLKPFKPEWE